MNNGTPEYYQIVSSDSRVTLKFTDVLSQIVINNKLYNVGWLLGKSNAIVLDVAPDFITLEDPSASMCLKIAKHGFIDLDEHKIKYINSHPDDFTHVYEFESHLIFNEQIIIDNINFGTDLDICIMEKVTATLHDTCKSIQGSPYNFSFRFINFVTQRLIEIVTNLVTAGYYYTDLKPGNIGIIVYGDQIVMKLIDVDSISRLSHQMLSTYYTAGGISPRLNIIRLQYLNVFFTVISLLFNDNPQIMCSADYSKFNYDQAMRLYMNWFNPMNSQQHSDWLNSRSISCIYYKYALLVGVYKIIEVHLGPDFRMEDVLNKFDEIVKVVSKVITNDQDHKSYYFEYIARCLVVMFLIFKCLPDDIPRLVNDLMTADIVSDGVPLSTKIRNKFFTQKYMYVVDAFIEPEVLVGVSIVNAMRRYIVKFCTDESCSGLRAYGDYFLNADYTGN